MKFNTDWNFLSYNLPREFLKITWSTTLPQKFYKITWSTTLPQNYLKYRFTTQLINLNQPDYTVEVRRWKRKGRGIFVLEWMGVWCYMIVGCFENVWLWAVDLSFRGLENWPSKVKLIQTLSIIKLLWHKFEPQKIQQSRKRSL
jgi:hypothetical protein